MGLVSAGMFKNLFDVLFFNDSKFKLIAIVIKGEFNGEDNRIQFMVCKYDTSFDDVLEFSDVSFPTVVIQCLEKFLCDAWRWPVGFKRELSDEVLCENCNILLALTKWRK